MRPRRWSRRARRHWLDEVEPIGWGLLAIAVLWYWALVWSLPPLGTHQASLHPHPDAPQYLDAAVNLIEGNGFGIHLAGQTLPSRYPPAYSVLLAAVIGAGVEPIEAPFLVNKWAGIALLVSVFLVAGRWGGPVAGLAAILLVTRSSFIVACRSPMSEVVTMLPTLWGCVLLYDYARDRGRWRGAAGIVLLGLATSFRTLALPLLALAPLAQWLRADLLQRDRHRDAVVGFGLVLATLAPLLAYNTLLFGAPWRTGYDFWLGGAVSAHFSAANLVPNLALYWSDLIQSEAGSTASHYAEGSYFAPAYVVLVLLALESLVARRVARWFAVAGGVYAFLLLFGPDKVRLLLPMIVLSIPPVAAATVERLRQLWAARRRFALTAASLLLLVTVAGWPGSRSDTDLGDLFRSHSLHWPAVEYDAVVLVEADAGGRPWLLLTDTDPAFAHAATSGDRVVAPLVDGHGYRFQPQRFRFESAERRRLIDSALAEGRRVYAAAVAGPDSRLADVDLPQGYSWQIRWRTAAGGPVALLERE